MKLQSFSGISNRNVLPSGVDFYTTEVITDYINQMFVIGFVSATVTDEDPEQHWSDNFRSQRMSNEARARIMIKIAGKLRRQLGERASMLNGNAVIGVKNSFVVEAEDGKIMGRAIGTAVRMFGGSNDHTGGERQDLYDHGYQGQSLAIINNYDTYLSDTNSNNTSPTSDISLYAKFNARASKHNRVTDADASRRGSIRSVGYDNTRVVLNIRHFPHGTISEIGGVVSAVSVKTIEDDSARTREIWWDELREELMSHSRFLFCQSVIGYAETCSVYDDIMVLYCAGTAANIDLSGFTAEAHYSSKSPLLREASTEIISQDGKKTFDSNPQLKSKSRGRDFNKHSKDTFCKILHAPYDHKSAPYPMRLKKCNICRSRYVPEIIFTTLELSLEIARSSRSQLIQAFTSYELGGKYSKSGANPTAFSEVMPFMQYDMHRQFLCKMRLFGFNAIHCLDTQITVSGTSITAISTGTGICLYALPVPPIVELKPSAVFDYRAPISGRCSGHALMKATSIREEISMEIEGAVNSDDRRSESSSSSSTSSASAYVRGTGTIVINLDDEPYNDSSIAIGYISTPNFKVNNSSFADDFESYDYAKSPEIYARPSVVSVIKCAAITPGPTVARQISIAFNQVFDELSVHYCYLKKCSLTDISYKIMRVKDNLVLMLITASSLGMYHDDKELYCQWILPGISPPHSPSSYTGLNVESDRVQHPTGGKSEDQTSPNVVTIVSIPKNPTPLVEPSPVHSPDTDASKVIITSLYCIPNMKVSRFLGRITFHLVRESTFVYSSNSSDSASKFHQSFITEIYAVIRTHVIALGGNAMLGYSIDQVIMNNNFKTHGYAVLSVSGDAVRVV